jgi:putative two-component system response regulator
MAHPVVGWEFAAACAPCGRCSTVSATTTSRFDGCGYPDGLAGRAIPFTARLLAVADALDALTPQRPIANA